MLSYDIYKLLHITMIILFFSSVGAAFLGEEKSKHIKILTGVSSFFIFVAGMGLMARLGVKHNEGWPAWAYAKLGIWVFVSAAAPILSKRVKKSYPIFYGLVGLGVLAAYIAINKPF